MFMYQKLTKTQKMEVWFFQRITDSVLCGYWCLYYLLERQRGVPMLSVIHNAKFDMNDQTVNHRFIIDYFKNI